MRRLPPLNALRAFEAAARHLSFSRAAEELNVTPAAVSHQIKALEERLGVALFRRRNRQVLLTESGQGYVAGVRDGFDRLAVATERLLAREEGGVLTVSVLPSLASRWLVPRLSRFHARHPEIELRIAATQALADFAGDDVDVAMRHGRGVWPGLHSELLLRDVLIPVCAPALMNGPHPLRSPQDLRHHMLLHDGTREDWQLWLRAAGMEDIDINRGPTFSDGGLLVQAAVEGQGVAVTRMALAGRDLAAGRLVQPFPQSLAGEQAYWLVCPAATAERPKIAAFRAWLLEEAAAGD